MRIKTVALIGAGAVGSYFIEGLYDKLNDNLCLVATGDRKERLEKEGVIINGQTYKLKVLEPSEAKGVDLVIVAVKYAALDEAIKMLKEVVDSNTCIICPMNGVDNEKRISESVSTDHVVYSMIKIASERKGNSVVYDKEATAGLFFGDAFGREEECKALVELFDDTPVRYNYSADIIRDMWFKYQLNISKNIPQAMIMCPFIAYRVSEHVAFISDRLRDEVILVARAYGIDISDTENATSKSSSTADWARFSTLQDLDAKRHTEIDMFCGALVNMAKEKNIKTPYNEMAYHIIKSLEEKNDGKFEV